MQKIIKNRPAETKREDSEKSPERGFRGLTSLGGLGELGNMLGGMGGMGGFGGMFRGPMGKRWFLLLLDLLISRFCLVNSILYDDWRILHKYFKLFKLWLKNIIKSTILILTWIHTWLL